jgi:DNA-binding transcriptional ArsR family regulator
MFSRWNLSRNPFDTNPISLGTLDWFIGRKREQDLCTKLIEGGSVVVIEGDLGVGTTSFGNVSRFQSKIVTPRMELSVYREWQAQTLLENALVALMPEIEKLPQGSKLKVVKKLRPLVKKVERYVHSAGISLLGFGGQVTRNVAVTQPGIVPLETLRQCLVELAEELAPPGRAAVCLQLNNLDPELTFSHDELETFLNDVRDCLQLPQLSWLLVGKSGLSKFISRRVPRLRSIIAHEVALSPLSLNQVRETLKRRLEACALPEQKPLNPIEPELLDLIFEATGGSLRETFLICSKLCQAVATDPVYARISPELASGLLAELLNVRFAEIRKTPLQRSMLQALSKNPGLTQGDLAEEIGKTQTTISRAAKSLIDLELIRKVKEGRSVRYWPAPEVRLAAQHI